MMMHAQRGLVYLYPIRSTAWVEYQQFEHHSPDDKFFSFKSVTKMINMKSVVVI